MEEQTELPKLILTERISDYNTMEEIRQALDVIVAAEKEFDRGHNLLRDTGFHICTGTRDAYSQSDIAVMLAEGGVRAIAEAIGAKVFHPKSRYFGEERPNLIAFVYDGVMFYELIEEGNTDADISD